MAKMDKKRPGRSRAGSARIVAFALACSLFLVGTAYAQTTALAVDIKSAKFTWQWAQGTGGVVEYFQLRCTKAGSTAPVLGPKTLATAREQPVLAVVGTPGDYTCAVVAGNAFGESPPSNQVIFRAGDVPAAATGFSVSGGAPDSDGPPDRDAN